MNHRLAVLVPYRNREAHLNEFAPALSKYLEAENIDSRIFIINQVDSCLFNRAKLLNVGFLETRSQFTYSAYHDVDMLPIKPGAGYDYFEGARQLYTPTEHSMGGISLVCNKVNLLVNGWSNHYWGWGGEDRNYMHRLKHADVTFDDRESFRKTSWAEEYIRELEGFHDPERKVHKVGHQVRTRKFKNNPHLSELDGVRNCFYKKVSVEEFDTHTMISVDLLCNSEHLE